MHDWEAWASNAKDKFQRYNVIKISHRRFLLCNHWAYVNKEIKSQVDVLNQNLTAGFLFLSSFFFKVQRNPLNNPKMILRKLKAVSVNCL